MKKSVSFVVLLLAWCSAFAQTYERAPMELRERNTTGNAFAAAGYYELGYCTDDTPEYNSGIGSGTALTLTVLIKLPASIVDHFVGDQIAGLKIGICDNLSNVVAVVRESPTGHNIASKTFNGTLGWNQVVFNMPLTLEYRDYYVGYTVSLAARQYAIGYSATNTTSGAFIIVDSNGTADYTSNFGALCVKALLTGNEADFSNIAEIESVNLPKYQHINSLQTIPVTIVNKGVNDINSVELSYHLETNAVVAFSISSLTIASNSKLTVYIPNVLMNMSGTFFVKVTKVNEVATTSGFVVKPVVVYDPANIVPRKVLIEQFTTEQCGYCPAGSVRIRMVMDTPEFKDKVMLIAHHAGYYTDSYTIPVSVSYLRFYGTGGTFAPAMMVDRTVYDELNMGYVPVASVGSEADIEHYLSYALNTPTFVSVAINQNNPTVTTDNKINITVSGEYNGTLPSEDLYVYVFLSEDGLTSTTQTGYSGTYTHNNVIRTSLSGAGGQKITWNGNTYSLSFTETLMPGWNKTKMSVTAFVAKSYLGPITNVNVLNAERQVLSLVASGLNEVYATTVSARFRDGVIHVDGEYSSFQVYSVEGKELVNNQLKSGVYLVKISNNQQLATKKVVVY